MDNVVGRGPASGRRLFRRRVAGAGWHSDLGKLPAEYVILQTYTITPQRAERVAFAGPYYESGQSIAVRRGTKGIAKPADLAGRKVIAGANTPAIAAINAAAPTAQFAEIFRAGVLAVDRGQGEAGASLGLTHAVRH